jgi:hypothetical protein
MKRRIMSVLVSALLGLSVVGVAPAAAATSYSNCDSLHQRFQYGVAMSRKAARRQVKSGHYKPRVSRSVYRANSSLDADKDGTACEVLR